MHYFLGNHISIVRFAPLIFLVSILIFLILGWLYGKYRLRTSDKVIVRDSLATAIFGLSALVLGFTFSSANEHFDKRISLMRAQSDAIYQVYQASKYLKTADCIAVQKAVQGILQDRLSIYEDVHSFKSLNENLDKLNEKLNKTNELVILSISRAPSSTRELAEKILGPQNAHMMDVFRDGILNVKNHPPAIIERFLFALLSIGALLSGYAMAVQKEEDWFLTAMYLGLMGLALYVIFSLEFPNQLFAYESINSELLRTQKLIQ